MGSLSKKFHTGWTGALLCCVLAVPARAQQTPAPAGAEPSIADLLSVDLDSLMDMEVTTASRFNDKLLDAPSIMSVVTSDELSRFGGLTLNEILQRVAGLTGSTSFFEDRTLVAARGDQTRSDGGHILFLINGRPTREVMDGGLISDLLESFPVDILERIEIIKGPGSVLYGSNAFSAVVNLMTKKAGNNQATIKGAGGARGAVDASGQFQFRRDELSIVGAVQFHALPQWPVTYLVPPDQRNSVVAPPVPSVENIDVVDGGVGAYLALTYKGLSFMGAFTESQSDGFIFGTVSPTRIARAFGNLSYERKVRRNWDMSLNLTFTRTTFKEVPFPDVTAGADESIIEWTNLITLGAKDRLSVGGLLNRVEGEELFTGTAPATITVDGRRLGGAFYAQLDHQLLKDLKLVGGFQSNRIGRIPLNTVPRGGAVWTPSSRISVKALYSEAFRAPSLEENLIDNPGLGGNPNLKPETVATFDTGIFFESNKTQIGVDYFHSVFNDLIVNTKFPNDSRSVYINTGKLTFNGAELEGKYYIRKEFFLQGSMLYQVNADGSGNTNLSPIPTLGFKAGGSYRSRGLTASLFDVSDGPITGYTAVNPMQGWHHIVNASFRYDLSRFLSFDDRTGIAAVVHANNLANQAVWLPTGFGASDTLPVQQGRAVFAGIEVFVRDRRH